MIGQRLGSFLIEEKVGSGAMGVVFRAVHEPTGKIAAIKVITGEAEQKTNVLKRFEREAEILKAFRHKHIVRFLAVGRYQGTNYFAMEYVNGGTLEDVLDRRGFLPWREAVDYSIEILDALQYAHDRHVYHRDLKPSNLLLTGKNQIKLTDFGIAKDEGAEALTATGRTLGTAAYMAPEQIRGDPPISHKTDLYAMGCLLFQMLTGHTPFKGNSAVVLMHQHLSEKPPRVSTKNPDVPRELDDLVLALMAKDPTKRPWDAQKVQHDLEDLAARADRGEPIPMVFGGGDAPARLGAPIPSPPTQAEPAVVGASSVIVGDPETPSRSGKARKPKTATVATDPSTRIERYKTLGLAATLVALVGLLVFMLWPPGAEKLHAQAQALMASKEFTDWTRAERDFLSELDRRFPDRYVEEKQAWRDKIALEKARRRTVNLEKPNLGRLSQPKPGAEELFVSVFNDAEAAIKAGDDEEAIRKWRTMADVLKPDDPEQRGWLMLAQERAEKVKAAMADREALVVKSLDKADRMVQDGQLDEARKLRQDILRRYGPVLHLQDLLRRRLGVDPAAPPAPKAAPAPSAAPDPAEESPKGGD